MIKLRSGMLPTLSPLNGGSKICADKCESVVIFESQYRRRHDGVMCVCHSSFVWEIALWSVKCIWMTTTKSLGRAGKRGGKRGISTTRLTFQPSRETHVWWNFLARGRELIEAAFSETPVSLILLKLITRQKSISTFNVRNKFLF